MSEEVRLLKEISRKLSQLIVLTKLSNHEIIEDMKKEIRKDKVFRITLDLADGSLSSSQLTEKVVAQTRVSERTAKRRISTLKENGALNFVRKGNEIYYENSGLYD